MIAGNRHTSLMQNKFALVEANILKIAFFRISSFQSFYLQIYKRLSLSNAW